MTDQPAWLLEEDAKTPGRIAAGGWPDQIPFEGEVATSIAISLKRIADALAPVSGQDVGSTLFYIEQRLGQVVCQ